MTRQMSAGAQVAFAKDWLVRQGIPPETIDVTSYIDRSLSYEENIKNLRQQFGIGKRGMDAPNVARGMTAAECDVAIGNFDAGYNGTSARDACVCGYQDACDDLERRKAAKAAKAAAKAKPAPTATEVAWQTARLHEREAAASKTAATARPVPTTEEEAYEIVCKTVAKDLAGKRVSDKKLREYAERHGFHAGWVESAYYEIKPSRSIESIEKDIKKVEEKAYKRSIDSRAQGGSRPGGGALDRDIERMWERKRTLRDELERAKSQKQGAAPAAAKPKLKTVKDIEQWIEKKSGEYGGRNEFICSSEYAEMYPEITRIYNQAKKQKEEEQKRVNIVKNPDGTGYVIKYIYRENAYVGGGGMMGGTSTFETVDQAVKEAKRSGYTIVSKPKPKKQPATMKQATNCVYRVDEFQQIAQAWWTSSTIPLQNSLDAAKKLVAKATKKRQRQIDKANRDWRPNAWGADPEHGPRRIVKICNGKEVEYYPATKADEERVVEYKAIYRRVGYADVPGATPAPKPKKQPPAATRTTRKPAPTPDMPPILTAPPELAADVLGGGGGLPPVQAAPKPKKQPAARKPAPDMPPILTAPPELAADVLGGGGGLPPVQAAPKPKKQPATRTAKKTAAKTRKTTKKAAKPKTKKTAATPKLTASQREYLAIQGFVMVKRGGKYVKVTG